MRVRWFFGTIAAIAPIEGIRDYFEDTGDSSIMKTISPVAGNIMGTTLIVGGGISLAIGVRDISQFYAAAQADIRNIQSLKVARPFAHELHNAANEITDYGLEAIQHMERHSIPGTGLISGLPGGKRVADLANHVLDAGVLAHDATRLDPTQLTKIGVDFTQQSSKLATAFDNDAVTGLGFLERLKNLSGVKIGLLVGIGALAMGAGALALWQSNFKIGSDS